MVKTHKFRRFKQSFINGFFALIMVASSATGLTTLPAYAVTDDAKPVTPTEFCSGLPLKSDSEKNACIDGWKGEDCSTYKLTHDEQHVNICQQGARGRSNINSQGGKTTDEDIADTVSEAVTSPGSGNGTSYCVNKSADPKTAAGAPVELGSSGKCPSGSTQYKCPAGTLPGMAWMTGANQPSDPNYCYTCTQNGKQITADNPFNGNDTSTLSCTKGSKTELVAEASSSSSQPVVDKAAYEKAIKAACAQFRRDASSIATNATEVWCLYGGLGQDGKEGIPKDDCLTKAELKGSDLNQKACLVGAKTGYAYLAGSDGKTKQTAATYSQTIATACQTFHGADNSGAASVWCLYGGLGQDGKEGIPKDDCLTKAELKGSDLNQKACLYGSKKGYETIYYNGGGNNPAANVSNSATNFSNSGETDILNMLINQTAAQIANGNLPLNNIPGLPGGSNSSVVNNFNAPDNLYGSYVNGAGKQQPLRVTRAPGNNRPVIIFINGGGFHNDDQMGDKVAPDAVKEGYTSIVATYRLGSAGLYYMYEDVLRAVRHVRNNAAMYGIDANRMVLWGDSAGGSLAMRVASSGKSGVKAAVGWSAPTNAYTILFHSFPSFADAVDHSTCLADPASGIKTEGGNASGVGSRGSGIPGLSNLSSLVGTANSTGALPNGGTVLKGITSSQGTTSPGTLQIPGFDTSSGSSSLFGNNPVTGIPNLMQSSLGSALSSATSGASGGGDSISSLLAILSFSQYGLEQGNSIKNTVNSLAQTAGGLSNAKLDGIGELSNPLPGSNISINPSILSAETLLKCIDNLDAASPALYASPLSPPTYLAGFSSDPVVPPQQAYDMRDKLRSLGIPSDAFIKHSDVHSAMPDPGRNHCDYCKEFLKPTFNFINKYINPKKDSGGGSGGAAVPSGGTGSNTKNGGSTAGNTVDPAYKSAIQQACNGFGQINPAAGVSCLYGGLGQNGTVGKPQSDCMTNAQFKNSPLNQQACQVGSTVGNSLYNK